MTPKTGRAGPGDAAGGTGSGDAGPGNVSYFRHHKALPEGLKRRLDQYIEEREVVRKQSVKELERRRLIGTVLYPKAGRRWALQRTAAKIMRKVETQTRGGESCRIYRYRVTLCNAGVSDWHWHGPKAWGSSDEPGGIRVYRSPDALRAEFRGVMTCGSTWHCPCCSPKIAKRRVAEVNHAMQLWQKGHQGVTDQAVTAPASDAAGASPGPLAIDGDAGSIPLVLFGT